MYAKAGGGLKAASLFLIATALGEGTRNLTDVWLSFWSDHPGLHFWGIGVYALCSLAAVAAVMCYVITRVFVGQWAARTLHRDCQHSLLRATMGWYDVTPQGRVVNRLAEDMSILDGNLPQTLGAYFNWMWRTCSIIVMSLIVSPFIVVPMIPLFFFYRTISKRYLPGTRDLRRLDAAARSPIFSHFGETINGIATVRATGQQDRFFDTIVVKLTAQMEAYYLSNTAPRWLSLRLSLLGASLVGCVSLVAIAFHKSMAAGTVGLALSYSMRLTDTLGQWNRESADLETQLVSVERVSQYVSDIPREAALRIEDRKPPRDWPGRGTLELSNICIRYRAGLDLVLRNLSLVVPGGSRVGVIGRTGCGKSTLLSTIMRLIEPESGRITLDGQDILNMGLHDLRSAIAIVPQDATIFTGTFRFNMDPFETASNDVLNAALEKVQLKERIEAAGGLEAKVEDGGGNLSVGQQQLLCLARTLVRRSKVSKDRGVLLLDEATASLDDETDKIAQKVIRSEFACTILTIAHRVQTIRDYDMIVGLKAGEVVEKGTPDELMKAPVPGRPSSMFRDFILASQSE